MAEFSTLSAVDLGSNSFRLEIGGVVDDQNYPLDSLASRSGSPPA